MIHSQNARYQIFICDGDVTAGETATGYIDTLGYDYCNISVCATTSNDTTNDFTTLTLSEGQTTAAWTAIAAFTGDDTTDGFTIAAADTSNPQVVAVMNVDLTKRERYLYLAISPLTSQAICAMGQLLYADETPTTATNLGVGVQVVG
jgi:hypothetical protein